MAKANTIITLKEPIEGPVSEGGKTVIGQIKTIHLRPPKWNDVMALGEPAAYARSEGGMVYQAQKDETIAGYVQRLLVEPKDPLLLEQLSLEDTLQLRDAVLDFFSAARAALLN